MGNRDQPAPIERAIEAASQLKAGTWEAVEALAWLAVEAGGTPASAALHQKARDVAAGLKTGNWQSVRALAMLARADRKLGSL